MKDLQKCDCCGAYTIEEEFDICPFCGWEQDRSQRKDPDELGANNVTLNQAKVNFRKSGKCS